MTIKPPERRPIAGVTGNVGAQPGAEAPERPGASFRDKLELPTNTAPAAAGSEAATSARLDSLHELLAAVRAGTLDREQAIERLIENNLERVGRGLSIAQRTELAAVLREAVEADPTLRALRDAIG